MSRSHDEPGCRAARRLPARAVGVRVPVGARRPPRCADRRPRLRPRGTGRRRRCSWSVIGDLVRRRVRALVPEQRPDVEGPSDRLLFSDRSLPVRQRAHRVDDRGRPPHRSCRADGRRDRRRVQPRLRGHRGDPGGRRRRPHRRRRRGASSRSRVGARGRRQGRAWHVPSKLRRPTSRGAGRRRRGGRTPAACRREREPRRDSRRGRRVRCASPRPPTGSCSTTTPANGGGSGAYRERRRRGTIASSTTSRRSRSVIASSISRRVTVRMPSNRSSRSTSGRTQDKRASHCRCAEHACPPAHRCTSA